MGEAQIGLNPEPNENAINIFFLGVVF